MRIGAGEILKLDQAELFERDRLAFRLRDSFHFEAKGHIAERRAPRKELGEVLEYDAAIHAVAGDRRAADPDFARTRRRESAMIFKSVDLPQPLGPTMQRNSELSMPKLTPWTAGTAPLGVR
jgi:RecB family exonuclease